jgi:hypothetical protein
MNRQPLKSIIGARIWSLWVVFFCTTLAAQKIPRGQQELLGTWAGERFWLRALPAGGPFGADRLVMIAAAPPEQHAQMAQVGAHPWVLLDGQARVKMWNERLRLSTAIQFTGEDYLRQAILLQGEEFMPREDRLPGPLVAEAAHWPFWLALVWQVGQAGSMPVRDLQQTGLAGLIEWDAAGSLSLGGAFFQVAPGKHVQPLQLIADSNGRLAEIRGEPWWRPDPKGSAQNAIFFQVDRRLPPPEDAAAWSAFEAHQKSLGR